MMSFVFMVFVLVQSSYTQADVCNPIINVNTEGNGSGSTKVTTEIQAEQTRQLFRNVSEQLLHEYEERFENFVSTLNISTRPRDCQDVYAQGSTETGIYTIYPVGTYRGFPVRCDMDTESGGWVVLQRRVSYSDFNKYWIDYQTGFGNLSENFWLGNQQIHLITSQGWYELRVDMTHPDGNTAYAGYNVFRVGDAESRYKLTVDGYHGDAGDSLTYHHESRFSTRDRDYDSHSSNCATSYGGAWWYRNCHHVNLNGVFGSTTYGVGMIWLDFTTHYKSVTKSEMKIRRWVPKASTTSASDGSG